MSKTTGKKWLSLLLVGVMLWGLAACNKQEADSTPATQDPGTASNENPVDEGPSFDVTTSRFLTGEEKTDDYPEGQRIVAVMVNNIISSRPTSGLSEASVLYEIKVEGGITRFMALFEDYNTMPEVGGIRSARDQFLQLVLPFQPFYVHDGPASPTVPVSQMMTDYDLWDFDLQPNKGVAFRRNRPGMPTEYTEYISGDRIAAAIENYDLDWQRQYNSPMFPFVPYTEPARVPQEGSANEIAIVHSNSYRTFFEFDAGSGTYLMSQRGSAGVTPTIDENNGVQLAFENVVVLFAPMTLYNASELVQVDYFGGAGYVFTEGGWETVLWTKGAANQPLSMVLLNDQDTVVELNPGKTYVAIVDDKELESFDTTLRAGNASEVANQGEYNPNESDADDE